MDSATPLRRAAAIIALFSVSILTNCGGGSGAPPQPSATPQPLQIISHNGNSITLTGTIVAMISSGFQIQGGPGIGFLDIYVNQSTIIVGPPPFVGENVEVAGTGTVNTYVTASTVTELLASPSPSPTFSPSPAPTGTIVPPAGVVEQTGQIAAVNGSKITVQTGPGCGSMYLNTISSTAYFDGPPKAGNYAAFTGTGNRCASVTAATLSVSGSPFSSNVVNGMVAQAEPYGFLLNTGSANVPVALSSSTVIFGSALAVGSQITLTALGTAATGFTATQIAVAAPPTPTPNPSSSPSPTPGPISATHVMMGSYIYGYAGTPTSVPLDEMTPYVTWTQTDQQHAAEIRAAGIKVAVYANFWRNYTSDNPIIGYTDLEPGGAHAAAEATDCSGTPIFDPSYGGGYEADARTSAALGHAQVVVNYRLGEYNGNYDALFADDAGAVWGITLPCNYDEATYDQAVNAVHSALAVPTWVNALGAPPDPVNAVDLLEPSNVLGGMCEECYASNTGNGDVEQTGTSWLNVEDAEIDAIAQHKVFWDYARATGPAAQETALRIYAYASFLLTYDPSYAMFEEALSTPSQFPVMPETGLVPDNPLTTQSTIAGYQAPGGSYMREFADCYYRGSFVSNCAVAVNPGPASVPVASTSYHHALALSGAGVLDGGSVAFNAPAPSQLAAYSAAILFP